MDHILSYILFSQFMALLICSVLQVTVKTRSRVNSLMAVLFFLIGYLLFYFWLYRTDVIAVVPCLVYSDLAVTFLLGPVGYAYINSMTGKDARFSLKSTLQYLPAVIVFFFFLYYNMNGNDQKSINRGSPFPDYHSDPLVQMISILADVYFFTYALLIVRKIYSFMRSEKFRSIKEIRIIFFIFSGCIVSSLLLFPAHFLKNDVVIGMVAMGNGSLSVLYFLFSYRHPEYTQMIIRKPKGGRDTGTLPVTIDLPAVMEKLILLMEKNCIYRDPVITLQSLSNLLEINVGHLSLMLNDKLGVNFRTFINRYRLEEAKELLAENHEKTVLEIAFYVGFNSKTAFNTMFAKTTGLTPTAYRKKFS